MAADARIDGAWEWLWIIGAVGAGRRDDVRGRRGRPSARVGVVAGEVVFNTALVGLPGDRHRSVVRGPDHHLHVSAHRQLRRERRRRRGARAALPRRDRARPRAPAVELARDRRPRAASSSVIEVAGIAGIDTRRLTRHIRSAGAMPGAFGVADRDTLLAAAQADGGTDGRDLVAEVTTARAVHRRSRRREPARGRVRLRDQAVDPRSARARGCQVEVVPASTPAADVLAREPDGVFLSNGPGDPAAVGYARDNIARAARQVAGVRHLPRSPDHVARARRVDVQAAASVITAATIRCATSRPVGSRSRARTTTTRSTPTSLPDGAAVTHLNLNDGDLEGMRAEHLRAFSVQYHPEAGPGPHDARYLFDEFTDLMRAG